MNKMKWLAIIAIVGLLSCVQEKSGDLMVLTGELQVEVSTNLHTRVNPDSNLEKQFMSKVLPTEFLVTKHFTTFDFILLDFFKKEVTDLSGKGIVYTYHGEYDHDGFLLKKKLEITTHEAFPGMALFRVTYYNIGKRDIQVQKWVNNAYTVEPAGDEPPFWSFQGGSTNARKDWVQPLDSGFYQENYLGMTSSDYGGGIPVTDIWRKDFGIAVGYTGLKPLDVSLPVDYDRYSKGVTIGVEYKYPYPLEMKPGDSLQTAETFVMIHHGDYFSALQEYTRLMKSKGMEFAEPEPAAQESMWCAWGYERNFTIDEIIGTLPKVKEMGINWVGLDDGYQIAEGDWNLNKERFPNGDRDMKRLVDAIHGMGMKAMIWWSPLAADPGSKILKEDPDILLFNEDWSPRYITWWDAWYMAPSYEGTLKHTREVLDMFLRKWDFDGIKIDGQHLNCVPPDYHPDHGLETPEESAAMLPEFFRMVYDYSRAIKPDAVIELCPCGCCMSYYLMPFVNQTVASDPTSSWQIRLKGKTYKAILGQTAYYGDHVELSDGKNDFASQIGIGAVPGTKFTWPKDNPKASASYLLTPAREEEWKKWLGIFNDKKLPEGEYLGGLYDIGYDKPETHVIRKDGILYYAFYAAKWKGPVEFRGLQAGKEYTVHDYVNDRDIGRVSTTNPVIDASFEGFMLVELL
jgi:alpha-galactosidase